MKKFKCVKSWARNQKDDIVEEYELRRFPESALKNYEEVKTPAAPEVKKRVETPVSTNIKVKNLND
jgi:hypothetical protein